MIGLKVGVGAESLRRWVLQAQLDASQRPGVTTAEQQRIKDLEREVRDLKEANEFLKTASAFFARELEYRVQVLGQVLLGSRASSSSTRQTQSTMTSNTKRARL